MSIMIFIIALQYIILNNMFIILQKFAEVCIKYIKSLESNIIEHTYYIAE